MVIVLMGVAGSGKTTVGKLLAKAIEGTFQEGDAFHSPENIDKMSRGIPLDDEDRMPWLQDLAAAIDDWIADGKPQVLSCSALKQSYRDILVGDRKEVRLIYLKASKEAIRKRMAARTEHFMPVTLLESQFAALEEPEGVTVVEAEHPPEEIVERLVVALFGDRKPAS